MDVSGVALPHMIISRWTRVWGTSDHAILMGIDDRDRKAGECRQLLHEGAVHEDRQSRTGGGAQLQWTTVEHDLGRGTSVRILRTGQGDAPLGPFGGARDVLDPNDHLTEHAGAVVEDALCRLGNAQLEELVAGGAQTPGHPTMFPR